MIDFDFATNKACAQWLQEERKRLDFYSLTMQEDGSTIYHSEFKGVEDAFSYWCSPVFGFSVCCDFLLVFVGNNNGLLVAVDEVDGGYEYRLACKKASGLPIPLKEAGYETNKVYKEIELRHILSLIS